MPDSMSGTMDLVRAAQGGDREALQRLISRYYPLVQKIVRLRMGARLRERLQSGDILNDAFTKAIARFNDFEMRNSSSLINWLCKLAENTIREAVDRENAQCRNAARERPLAGNPSSTGGGSELAAPVTHLLDQMINAEEAATVVECLDLLPPAQLELIVLREYDGLSFAEIRQRTGRASEGAARVAHAKAIHSLRQLFVAKARERRAPPH